MNNLGVILKYELKKLMVNKVTILALIVGAGFLFGITMAQYLLISPNDKYITERDSVLDGRLFDEQLIREVTETAIEYDRLDQIPADNPCYQIASYMIRLLGTYMNVDGITGAYSLRELTEEKVYQTRNDMIEYFLEYFCLSDAEKDFWYQEENKVEKPFIWYANHGPWAMRSSFALTTVMSIMMIGICTAGIFASEYGYRTHDLILCSKEGKGTVIIAKLLGGEIFSVIVGTILLLSAQLPHLIFNGVHGLGAPCQIVVPFTSYPYTALQLLGVCTLLYLLSALLTGAVSMLLSCTLKNGAVASGVVCIVVMMDMFLSIPAEFRVAAQIRYLTPVQVLNSSSITDPRLLRIGSIFLTSYQTAGVVYLTLAVLLCLGSVYICKRRTRTFHKKMVDQ